MPVGDAHGDGVLTVQEIQPNFQDYFTAQKTNLDNAFKFAPFAVLFPIVHDLYVTAARLIPPDHQFGPFVLIGHKEFLAAASLIGQAQPDEAVPITRRAIEMAQAAVAFRKDSENIKKWTAFPERIARWIARQRGEKPRRLNVKLADDHPSVQELMGIYGMMSDTAVHFTPEHVAALRWEAGGGERRLQYFNGDQRIIEREILLLVSVHILILKLLDWCMDNAISKDVSWTSLMTALQQKARPFAEKFKPSEIQPPSP